MTTIAFAAPSGWIVRVVTSWTPASAEKPDEETVLPVAGFQLADSGEWLPLVSGGPAKGLEPLTLESEVDPQGDGSTKITLRILSFKG
jgi:hypothetical protein